MTIDSHDSLATEFAELASADDWIRSFRNGCKLSVDKAQSIQHLHSLGWSQRKIAEAVSVDRKSVRRHLAASSSKGTSASAEAPTGPESLITATQCTVEPTSSSTCGPYRQAIIKSLERGLEAKRIFQDLVAEHGFGGSYWSVNRFIKRLTKKNELPFRRIETLPGEEAQIDFGVVAPYIDAEGKKRRPHVLRVVLSHSHKGLQ
jgi:transposase